MSLTRVLRLKNDEGKNAYEQAAEMDHQYLRELEEKSLQLGVEMTVLARILETEEGYLSLYFTIEAAGDRSDVVLVAVPSGEDLFIAWEDTRPFNEELADIILGSLVFDRTSVH